MILAEDLTDLIVSVLAHRASPPEYPGMALVPVADLDALAASLPRWGDGDDGEAVVRADFAAEERDALREENARLRAALETAANRLTPVPGRPYCACTDTGLCLAHTWEAEARAALRGPE